MTKVFGIYGASGCGRGIMPLARLQLKSTQHENLYFIDDSNNNLTANGHKVLSYKEFMAIDASKRYIAIAISNSRMRNKLANKIELDGCHPWSIIADSNITMDNVKIGEGSLLSPNTVITSNIHIGKYFHGNIASYVEHDCSIGDYVTFAPRASCNGNVIIEDHAYIGAGAVIKQGTPENPLIIGCGAVIGMGAIVTKSVPVGATVVGNPAKLMKNIK